LLDRAEPAQYPPWTERARSRLGDAIPASTHRPPYRVCIVGLGIHGSGIADQLLKSPERWSLSSLVDASIAPFFRFRSFHPREGVRFYRDVREALALEPDAVVVATPAPSHVPIARLIIETGFRGVLLIEKPVSNSVAEAERLLELARASADRVRLGVDFHRRCSELFGNIERRVRSGEHGALVGIEFSRACKLSMNGAHFVDLANWFMASRPVNVSASLAELSAMDHRGTYYFDPPGTAEVTYENGLVFRLDALGKPAPGGRTGTTVRLERAELWVDADESVLEINAGGSVDRIPSDRGSQALNWVETTLLSLLDPSTGYRPCSLPEAVDALSVIVAAHLSDARGNRTVALPLGEEDKQTALRVA